MRTSTLRRFAPLCLGGALFCGGVLYAAASFAQAPAAPPVPRTADGRPDLTGIYVGTPGLPNRVNTADEDPEYVVGRQWASRDNSFENFQSDNALRRMGDRNKPIYKPEHWQLVRDNDYWGNWRQPGYFCLPEGVPALGAPAQIVQLKDQVILLYAGGFFGRNSVRVVPIDKPHSLARMAQETFLGDPVAKWDGDTLVVETIGFNDVSWLNKNGYMHGFNMKVTERFTRTGNTLRWEATVEDPDYLQEPWKMTPVNRQLNTDPNAFVAEDLPCQADFLLGGDGAHLVSRTRSG
jgi:hypothetical protein